MKEAEGQLGRNEGGCRLVYSVYACLRVVHSSQDSVNSSKSGG